MNIQEILVLIAVLFLFLISFFILKYSLFNFKSKIELYKRGALKSKQIEKLIKRMDKLGKFKYYLFQGIIVWGLFISIIISIMDFLDDKFIDKEEVIISDYFVSFISQFILFSIIGLYFKINTWKSLHD